MFPKKDPEYLYVDFTVFNDKTYHFTSPDDVVLYNAHKDEIKEKFAFFEKVYGEPVIGPVRLMFQKRRFNRLKFITIINEVK